MKFTKEMNKLDELEVKGHFRLLNMEIRGKLETVHSTI
jgi:hypothetical protein